MSAHAAPRMHPLTGERLLAACDRAEGEHALLRAINLLAVALPEVDAEQLLQLSLAERNRLLLQLHRLSYGNMLDGYATCTACGAAMEFSLSITVALEGIDSTQSPALEWSEDGTPLRLRQVSTADLLATLHASSAEQAEIALLARCLELDMDVGCDAPSVTAYATRPSVREHFEHLHANSELRCNLRCPDCAHSERWELDLAHFLWLKTRHAAHRLLADIHTIALHYGWSEAAIANMSAPRRDAYLELLSA